METPLPLLKGERRSPKISNKRGMRFSIKWGNPVKKSEMLDFFSLEYKADIALLILSAKLEQIGSLVQLSLFLPEYYLFVIICAI